jgi:stearoyl-CoA desaturase (delta-9 desaturase)
MFTASAKNISILQLVSLAMTITGGFFFDFTWTSLVYVLIGYFLYSGIGVSMMLHRYYSHHSFEFKSDILKWICTWFAIVAGRGSPLGWVYVHRLHHTHSDTLQDPHDPETVGWKIFFPHLLKYGDAINKRIIIDMLTKFHISINTHYMWFIILWSVALLMISPTVFYFFYVIPFTMSFIALDFFVFLSHKYGYRNFETKDTSKNNWFISLILWGEGWHNNHHKNPGNFTTKIKWWEIDLLGNFINIFRKKT